MDLGRGQVFSGLGQGDRYSVDLGRGQVFSGLGQGDRYSVDLSRGTGIQWTWAGGQVFSGLGQGDRYSVDLGRGTGIQWTWAGGQVFSGPWQGGRYSVDHGLGHVFSGLGQVVFRGPCIKGRDSAGGGVGMNGPLILVTCRSVLGWGCHNVGHHILNGIHLKRIVTNFMFVSKSVTPNSYNGFALKKQYVKKVIYTNRVFPL